MPLFSCHCGPYACLNPCLPAPLVRCDPYHVRLQKRNALWIEYLEDAAASFVFTDQPVASCQPSDEQYDKYCNALGERRPKPKESTKKPGFL